MRTPVLPSATTSSEAGADAKPESDEEFRARLQKKSASINISASTLSGEVVDPKTIAESAEARPVVLGDVFSAQHFEITEEQLVERGQASTSFSGADAVWDEMTEALVRVSCAYMAQELLQGPLEPPYDGRFLVSEHHEEWDRLVTKEKRICVLAPRDHSKTFFFDFAYPIWKAITQPNGIGFIFSATSPQAERILDDIKTELETNPKLQWLVPKKKTLWSSKVIRLSNGHRIYARGFGTKVRGAHPNWIVVDDGLNDETAYSELVRKKQIDYFYTAITNMIIPGGQIIVVGTPFHQMDLYADLEKNPEYVFKRYQAMKKDGVPLWPERYDKKRLDAKQREIGTVRFTREFQCEPIGDDMSLFPGHLFRGKPTEQPLVKLGMPARFWDAAGVTRYMGVDFAMSSSVQADYTVIWVMGVDKKGNRWIVDIIREKGLPYQKQQGMIIEAARKYSPSLIYLESNQMQQIFGDELIRTTDLPIKKFITGVQKNALDKGVPSLRVLLENGKFRIPRGDARSIELTETWVSEMRSFTWHEGKLQGVGGHDDTVMACWICDQAIRQGGFSFSFGEDGDTIDPDNLDETDDDDYLGEKAEAVEKAARDEAEAKRKNKGPNDVDDDDLLPPGLEF